MPPVDPPPPSAPPTPGDPLPQAAPDPGPTPASAAVPGQVRLILGIVFLTYLGQMTLVPVIAPFARETGLAEWQVGLTISLAAITVVVTSQFWGSRAQSWGRKPVLIAALTLATASMTLFAVLASLGIAGIVRGVTLFVLFLLLRGLFFGAAIAAVPPTAQAFVAAVTDSEEARVRGLAGVGAAQSLSLIGGSVFGGLLAGFGLLTAIWAVPVVLALALLLVLVGLRPERRTELLERPVAVRARDPRVFPYLVAGFGLFSALGLIQILIGFLIQDRFALTGEQTGIATGGTMLGAGIGMVIAQAVIVPKIRFSPPALSRLGAPIAMLGFLAILVDLPLWSLVTAVFLVGVGMGIATPGYMAGPTLRVRPDEQGGLAGLIGATNGLTFVVTPTAGTALYALWQPLPMIAGAALLGTVALLAFLHPAFRTSAGPGVPAGPETPDEAALP